MALDELLMEAASLGEKAAAVVADMPNEHDAMRLGGNFTDFLGLVLLLTPDATTSEAIAASYTQVQEALLQRS